MKPAMTCLNQQMKMSFRKKNIPLDLRYLDLPHSGLRWYSHSEGYMVETPSDRAPACNYHVLRSKSPGTLIDAMIEY
jgi:hypothetical protein